MVALPFLLLVGQPYFQPVQQKPKLGIEEAETSIFSRLAKKGNANFIYIFDRCALNQDEGGRRTYAFKGPTFTMESPDKPGFYGWLNIQSLDANSGDVITDVEAGVGGKVQFVAPFKKLAEERYRAIVTDEGRRANVKDGTIREFKAVAVRNLKLGSRRVALVGKQVISFAVFNPEPGSIFLSFDQGWYEAVPDERLKQALLRLR